MTAGEYVTYQLQQAENLRGRILKDSGAPQALLAMAADSKTWGELYLASLTDAGLLRPEDEPPTIRTSAEFTSLMHVLAAGLLKGKGGQEIVAGGNLPAFFQKVREWYGTEPDATGGGSLPADPSKFDLGLSHPTHYVAYTITVGEREPPPPAPIDDPNLGQYFGITGARSNLVTMVGPNGFSDANLVPAGTPLPYSILFENSADAQKPVSELRILQQLDSNVDMRSFKLGDIRLGDVVIHLPGDRAAFTGEFDFVESRGIIVQVSAGVDITTGIASWVITAIDPLTGLPAQDSSIGLLFPNKDRTEQGLVSYSIKATPEAQTGDVIEATARVILDANAPIDSAVVSNTLDAVAPTTTLVVQDLGRGGYSLSWKAVDDSLGSGVASYSVYVSVNGGSYVAWKSDTTTTSGIYEAGGTNTASFLVLALDRAGNQEVPPAGIRLPSSGAKVNLGGIPVAPEPSSESNPAATVVTVPASNLIYLRALQGIAGSQPTDHPSSFNVILEPFSAQAFAWSVPGSGASIGPLGIAFYPDGERVLVSGGAGRNALYRFSLTGGEASTVLATLDVPVYDMGFDENGYLWATTGGGPLVQLDPGTGEILARYGDGVGLGLAVDPNSSKIFVSTGRGVESFDPQTGTFDVFSETRVHGLAFAPDGTLWGTTWPYNGEVVRFNRIGRAETVLEFAQPAGGLTFGQAGTALEGLLFVSFAEGGDLAMVDLASLGSVMIASGGSRGDFLHVGPGGRLFVTQSNQVDVFLPVVPPRVLSLNPLPGASILPVVNKARVTFTADMAHDDSAGSVLQFANYSLKDIASGQGIAISGVAYDSTSRSAVLSFEGLPAGEYELTVSGAVRSQVGAKMETDYQASFVVMQEFPSIIPVFTNIRTDHTFGTITMEVTITNTESYAILSPIRIVFDGLALEGGGVTLEGRDGASGDGHPYVQLEPKNGSSLAVGESCATTITLSNPLGVTYVLRPRVLAVVPPNLRPVFTSTPSLSAKVGEKYVYGAQATDSDGSIRSFLLIAGPTGAMLDMASGVLTWTPAAGDSVSASFAVRVYDNRGGFATQSWAVGVEGGNHAPTFAALANLSAKEGELVQVWPVALDADGDSLIYSADHLPPGAVFDPVEKVLTWRPGYLDAGIYQDVTLTVSDGRQSVSRSFKIVVENVNQAPVFGTLPSPTILENEHFRYEILATDSDKDAIRYSSPNLPLGATLAPETGVLDWTPGYSQHGVYDLRILASDGKGVTEKVMHFEVLNVNGPVRMVPVDAWAVFEGQALTIRLQALDPDQPTGESYQLPDGTLVQEGTEPVLSWTHSSLPSGAAFDTATQLFRWTPGFAQAGSYQVTFHVADNGDGTGTATNDQATLVITVFDTNAPPVVQVIGNKEVEAGKQLEFLVRATDPNGTVPVLSIVGLPEFGTFKDNGDGTGLIRVSPGMSDRGSYTVTVRATDDGNGVAAAALSGEYTFILTSKLENAQPVLSYIGDRVAVVGEALVFKVTASDLDQTVLNFSGANLPVGATLIPSTLFGVAEFRWTPTAADLGARTITIRVTDDGNGVSAKALSDSLEVRLTVRAANTAPVLPVMPAQFLKEGETLSFKVTAQDDDGDKLFFGASQLPAGAKLDPSSGTLTWQPGYLQAGSYSIKVEVSDGNKTALQTLSVSVGNVNRPPVISPILPVTTLEGLVTNFQVSVGDPDGDGTALSVAGSLPSGATLDAKTGVFSWTPDYTQAGAYGVRFVVTDTSGAFAFFDAQIQVTNVNRAPTVPRISSRVVLVDQSFSLDFKGLDPDPGTDLTYTLTGLPVGASFDGNSGKLTWTPTGVQQGTYNLRVVVSDGELTASQTLQLVVSREAIAPHVRLETTPSFAVLPGQSVWIQATASGIADIAAVSIRLDGELLTLDSFGRASFVPAEPGQYHIVATAVDIDAVSATVESDLLVRDPTDLLPPVLRMDGPLQSSILHGDFEITGAVQDTNLLEYRVGIARHGTSEVRTLAMGNSSVEGRLALLRAGDYANGIYVITLSATDIGGRRDSIVRVVEISSSTSTGAQVAVTDGSYVLNGYTLEIRRSYSSREATSGGLFGNGWSFIGLEPDFASNAPLTGEEGLGVYAPYAEGTRAYVTGPDGKRVGFTFAPTAVAGPGVALYRPAWSADEATGYRLETVDVLLEKAGGAFYQVGTGLPYNLTKGGWGEIDFSLIASSGARFDYSVKDGLRRQTSASGVVLSWSESGVVAANGDRLQFQLDRAGRVSGMADSRGALLTYDYDNSACLILTNNLKAGSKSFYGYDETSLRLGTVIQDTGSFTLQYASDGTWLGNTAIDAFLGVSQQYLGTIRNDSFTSLGQAKRYAFVVTESEFASAYGGELILGLEVESSGSGLTEIATMSGAERLEGSSETRRSRALYRISAPGVYVVEEKATGSGAVAGYTLEVFLAGDTNSDRRVDGTDAVAVQGAQGKVVGSAGYTRALDANRDGRIDGLDLLLVGRNSGFKANQAPSTFSGTVTTHTGLRAAVPLSSLVQDFEGDRWHLLLGGASHGTVLLGADGKTAIFEPELGYSGVASFTFSVTDGYRVSEPSTVTVTVSSSPLLRITLTPRHPAMIAGQSSKLTVLGDFADQLGVELPASYVSYSSSNASVMTVTTEGRLLALGDGGTTLVVSKGPLHDATAVLVGTPVSDADRLLLAGGLKIASDSYTISTGGGTQSLFVIAPDGSDLTLGSAGTIYTSTNDEIGTVSADGLITGLTEGTFEVIVTQRFVEKTIRITVVSPQSQGQMIGVLGGMVRNADGYQVALPAGALEKDTAISIQKLEASELGYALLPGMNFAAAFRLEVGTVPLARRAQLGVPVLGLAAGTEVILYRMGTVPGVDGTSQKAWIQTEYGVVGADGLVHTGTPLPTTGVRKSGDYLVSFVVPGSLGSIRGTATLQNPVSEMSSAFYVQMQPSTGGGAGLSFGLGVAIAIELSYDVGFRLIDAEIQRIFDYIAMVVPRSWQIYHCETIIDTPAPVFTSELVEVLADKTVEVDVVLPNKVLPTDHPSKPAVVTRVRYAFEDLGAGVQGVVQLTVERLLWDKAPEGLGSKLEDVEVSFTLSGATGGISGTGDSPVIKVAGKDLVYDAGSKVLKVPVPLGVTVGIADIKVLRHQNAYVPSDDGSRMVLKERVVQSKAVRVPVENRYVFAALSSENKIMVVDTRNPEPSAVLRMTVFAGSPRALTLTMDLTRVYATIQGQNEVAVFDAVGLQPLDVDMTTPEVDTIQLPEGANAFWVASDSANEYLFVTDEQVGAVYVIDIMPYSKSYHQVVQTVYVTPAPSGLRGIAVDADGTKVYMAAPDSVMFGRPGYTAEGQILVCEIDRTKREEPLKQVAGFVAGNEPYGVTAGSRSGQIVFANRQTDGQGFGSVSGILEQFAAMNLGIPTDAFDVNNAIAAAVLPDGSYAFVTAFNRFMEGLPSHDPNIRPFTAGGNIGIVVDPFGSPKLVAATIMVPLSFPDNLVLSPDGKKLLAGYRGGLDRGIYVYDVEKLIATVRSTDAETLSRMPLDKINPEVFIGKIDTGMGRPQGLTSRLSIGADLTVSSFTNDAVEPGQEAVLNYSVSMPPTWKPDGSTWSERIYLVNDSGYSRLLAENFYSETGKRNIKLTIPSVGVDSDPGSVSVDLVNSGLRWEVRLDESDGLLESNEANNKFTAAIRLQLPNLFVASIDRPWLWFDEASRTFQVISDKSELNYVVKNGGDGRVPLGVQWAEEIWIGTDQDYGAANDIAAGVWHLRVKVLKDTSEFSGSMMPGTERVRNASIDFSGIVVPKGIDPDKLVWVVAVDTVAKTGGSSPTKEMEKPTSGDVAEQPAGTKIAERKDGDKGGKVDNIETRNTPVGSTNPLRFEPASGWKVKPGEDNVASSDPMTQIKVGFEPEAGSAFKPLFVVTGAVKVTMGKKGGFAGSVLLSGKAFSADDPSLALWDGEVSFRFGADGKLEVLGRPLLGELKGFVKLGGVEFSRIGEIGLALKGSASPDGKTADKDSYPGELYINPLVLKLPEGFGAGAGSEIDISRKLSERVANVIILQSGGRVAFAAEALGLKGISFKLDGFIMEPSSIMLVGERLDASKASAAGFDSYLTLSGFFKLPQFADSLVELKISSTRLEDLKSPKLSPHFLITPNGGGSRIEMTGVLNILKIKINKEWLLGSISIIVNGKTDGTWEVLGTAKGGDNTDKVWFEFTFEKVTEGTDKVIKWTLKPTEKNLKVMGIDFITDVKVTFVPDRNTKDSDLWDPQFEMSGRGDLPAGLIGEKKDVDPELDIIVPDKDGQRLLINEEGIYTADKKPIKSKSIAKAKAFKSLECKIEDTSIEFVLDTKEDEYGAIFRAKITLETLYATDEGFKTRQVIIDFTGKDKYVKLTNKGFVVVGEITFTGPFFITKDGSYRILDIKLTVDTSDPEKPMLKGETKLKAPEAEEPYEASLTITPTNAQLELTKKDHVLKFQLVGFEVTVKGLRLVLDRNSDDDNAWDPELALQGEMKLPEKLTGGRKIVIKIGADAPADEAGDGSTGSDSPKLAEEGGDEEEAKEPANEILVNSDGIEITGGEVVFASTETFLLLGKLEVKATDARLKFVYTKDVKKVTLGGKFEIPALNGAVVDMTKDPETGEERGVTIQLFDGVVKYQANAKLTVDKIDLKAGWSFQKIVFEVKKDFDGKETEVTGETELHSPDKDSMKVKLAFKNGRLDYVEFGKEEGVKLGMFGVEIVIKWAKFIPDVNSEDKDLWDPKLELQGSITLPEKFGKLVGGGKITGEVEGKNKLVINEREVYLTGGSITFGTVKFSLFNVIEVEGRNLKLTYTRDKASDSFVITGVLGVTIRSFTATADFAEEKGNYIEIVRKGDTNEVNLKGKIEIGKIEIVPGAWILEKVALEIDTKAKKVTGTGSLTFPPGITLEATVGFFESKLNTVGLKIENITPPIALGTTGAFLYGIGAQIDNISDPKAPIKITGTIILTAGPAIHIPLPSMLGGPIDGTALGLDITVTLSKDGIEGSGEAVVVGNIKSGSRSGLAVGSLGVGINWKYGTFYITGTLNFLFGTIIETGKFNISTGSGFRIDGSGSATVRIPDAVPIIGGYSVGSGNGLLHFSVPGGYVAGWGVAEIPIYGKMVLGIQVNMDGSWRRLGVEEVGALTGSKLTAALARWSVMPHLPTLMAGEVAGTFDVQAGTKVLLAGASWDNKDATPGPLFIQKPDGTRISEAEFAANGMAVVNDLSGLGRRTVVIQSPSAGLYRLILSNGSELGSVQFSALRESPFVPPTMTVTNPSSTVAGPEVSIDYQAFSPGNEAKVYLFYDTDNVGYDGISLGDALAEKDGPGSYTWNVSNLPAGDYFVYGVILAEGQVPVYSKYSSGKVHVGANPTVTLSGSVYLDSNGNRVRDVGETGLKGWRIFADADADGVLDPSETVALTDETGAYLLTVESRQSYQITVEVAAGFAVTQPNPANYSSYPVDTLPGAPMTSLDFGMFQSGMVSGILYLDRNGNGSRDAEDTPMPGIPVLLDVNGNGAADAGELSVVSAVDGSYRFTGVAAGAYTVVPLLEANYSTQTRLVTVGSGGVFGSVDLGSYVLGSLRGTVYLDRNSDGFKATDESGLGGVTVFLDANGDGLLSSSELVTRTSSAGEYVFEGLGLGSYIVRQLSEGGLELVVPTNGKYQAEVSTSGMVVSGLDFGNRALGLYNGGFDQANSAKPDFGWATRGSAVVVSGEGVLNSGGEQLSQFSQTFLVPANTLALRFTLVSAQLSGTASESPTAFEVALVSSSDLGQTIASISEFTRTDATVNLQSDGSLRYSSNVKVAGAGASGQAFEVTQPVKVEIDLRKVPAGSVVTLFFNLVGTKAGSRVVVDHVAFVSASSLEFDLASGSDSGVKGDRITNIGSVGLTGGTGPNQEVLLDLDGDGFDDGRAVADVNGEFGFSNVGLKAGENLIRMQITNATGTVVASRTIVLDQVAPKLVDFVIVDGQLQRSMVTNLRLGFDEDVSASLSANNLVLQNTTTSVPVDAAALQLQMEAQNRVRIVFSTLPGGSLVDGNYVFQLTAAGITDAAGNQLQVTLPGGSNGVFSSSFFRYFGDIDGDRDVDFYDTYWFRRAHSSSVGGANYAAAFDVNSDGTVGSADLSAFRGHYMTRLPESGKSLVVSAKATGYWVNLALQRRAQMAGGPLVSPVTLRFSHTVGLSLITKATLAYESMGPDRIRGDGALRAVSMGLPVVDQTESGGVWNILLGLRQQ